jgi:hypothetical protein
MRKSSSGVVWALGAALAAQDGKIETQASLLTQARVHWQREETAAMLEVLQRAEKRWPKDPSVLLGLGQVHAVPGENFDRDTALSYLGRFLAAFDAAVNQFDPLGVSPLDELARFVELPPHGSLDQLRVAVADQAERLLSEVDETDLPEDVLALAFSGPDPRLLALLQELADARRLRQRPRLIAAATRLLLLQPRDPLPCLALGEAHGAAGTGFSQTRALLALARFLALTAEDAEGDRQQLLGRLVLYLGDRKLDSLAAVRGRAVAWRTELARGQRLYGLTARTDLELLLEQSLSRAQRARTRITQLQKDLAWWRASRRSDAQSTIAEIQKAIGTWQHTLADLQAEAQVLRAQIEQCRRAEAGSR